MIYNLLKNHRVHVPYANIFFFLHSEEFLHDEMGSCYTSDHIPHL